MARIIGLAAFVVMIGTGCACAQDYPFLDGLTRYAERIDTLSVTSGDAQDVNAAIQTINPWPRHAFDRRIPANGQRMVGAVNRFQNPNTAGAPPPPIAPVIQIGGGGQGAGGQ
jgi:hypothetical protein